MLQKLDRKTAGIKHDYPVKVLQFGDGNFLRGFMDWMIDLANEKAAFNGAIQIVRPLRKGKADKSFEQEGLFHVAQRGLQNGKTISETRLISCVKSVVNPYADFNSFLKAGENPQLQLVVSNTTEAGITFKASDLLGEQVGNTSTELPETFPGKLTLLLYHRFNFFKKDVAKGLTCIPCELIEKNGTQLRDTVLQYIKHWNLPDDFKAWIILHNTFCNTLVDRIVPGFPKDAADEIQKQIGFEDNQLVMAEPYHLLVIEAPDHVRKIFSIEQTGLHTKFVNDITPYRIRKVRILNGAHTVLVPIAYLRGLRIVNDSINDSFVGEFTRKAIEEEIIPTLDLPEDELKQFAADVLERFQNPFIKHELISIALNSISKFKVRVLPSILEYHARTGKLPNRLLQALAALIIFYKGTWKGETILLQDSPDVLSFFKTVWATHTPEDVVQKTLSNTSFWETDLTKINHLKDFVTTQVNELLATE